MLKVVIITGLSGAGRSRTADWFEDQGYYCVDNMPPALIKSFLELSSTGAATLDKIVFVTDTRTKNFFADLERVIDSLKSLPGLSLSIVYLEATNETLVKRYSELRRPHPLSGGKANIQTIEKERSLLNPIRKRADIIIDTTGLKVANLYTQLNEAVFGGVDTNAFKINITSFGFKYGIPVESDLVMDMRFLRNPYYLPSLKKLTGNNRKVVNYVMKDPGAKPFLDSFHATVNGMIEGYIREGKYHINIAIGCTGGHHRSVAMVNALAKMFEADGITTSVMHRDLDLMAKGL
ncbi:MAG: RNase adapter RapZ [Clostridiales bacterium]|jgi:UPF0042 nucleotide-binding protein|nr:RNase adapter RapZ [Clostridiales bacterium]